MDKEKALQRLDDAKDLIVEAKYIIEEVLEHNNILKLKDLEYLSAITEIIGILSKIESNELRDLPVEAVYKYLYLDYKKAQEEVKKLRQDIVDMMSEREIDNDNQVLALKLLRAEREIQILQNKNASQREKARRKLSKYSYQIKDLKSRLGEELSNKEIKRMEADLQDLDEEESAQD